MNLEKQKQKTSHKAKSKMMASLIKTVFKPMSRIDIIPFQALPKNQREKTFQFILWGKYVTQDKKTIAKYAS